MWGDSRMVLIVPLGDTQDSAHALQQRKSESTTSPNNHAGASSLKHPQSSGGGVQSGGGEGSTGGERKRRRKAKLEPLVQEVEEGITVYISEHPGTRFCATSRLPKFSWTIFI